MDNKKRYLQHKKNVFLWTTKLNLDTLNLQEFAAKVTLSYLKIFKHNYLLKIDQTNNKIIINN